MTQENKRRLNLALLNASELIRGHCETGIAPDEVCEETEEGLKEYIRACERASKLIYTLAKKYDTGI